MNAASNNFSTEHTGHTAPNSEKHQTSSRGHYFLVAILLAVAFLLSTWVATAPNPFSPPQTWSVFALFWMGGGLVTLFLLTLAARR